MNLTQHKPEILLRGAVNAPCGPGHPADMNTHGVPASLEDAGDLDEAAEALLDPNLGALTQIVEEYKPEGTPVIVADVARDIDAIVKQVRFTGWTATQDGDRLVRKELRERVLLKYGLPPTGPLFNNASAYVAENY